LGRGEEGKRGGKGGGERRGEEFHMESLTTTICNGINISYYFWDIY